MAHERVARVGVQSFARQLESQLQLPAGGIFGLSAEIMNGAVGRNAQSRDIVIVAEKLRHVGQAVGIAGLGPRGGRQFVQPVLVDLVAHSAGR